MDEPNAENNNSLHQRKPRLRRVGPILCDICGRGYSTRKSLGKHMLTHTKNFQCEVCNMRFSKRQGLITHSYIHTGERPYVCDACGKGYKSNDHLTVHKRRAHEPKPEPRELFECAQCLKKFTSKDHLRVHQKVHSDERPHQCELCSKSFKYKPHLRSHMRTHSNERPYACDACPKTFTQKRLLKSHFAKCHATEKRHHCTICHVGYSFMKDLNHHNSILHSSPIKCDACKEEFYSEEQLEEHSLEFCLVKDRSGGNDTF